MNFIGRLKKFDSHIIANKYFWTLIGCTHANQLKYFSMYLTRGKTVAHPSPTWTLGPLMQCTYPPSIPRLPRFENHHLQSTDKMAAFPSCSSPSHHIFPPPPPTSPKRGPGSKLVCTKPLSTCFISFTSSVLAQLHLLQSFSSLLVKIFLVPLWYPPAFWKFLVAIFSLCSWSSWVELVPRSSLGEIKKGGNLSRNPAIPSSRSEVPFLFSPCVH